MKYKESFKSAVITILVIALVTATMLAVDMIASPREQAEVDQDITCVEEHTRCLARGDMEAERGNKEIPLVTHSGKGVLVLAESGSAVEDRDWYRWDEDDEITKDRSIRNITVSGKTLYSQTGNLERQCSELPLKEIQSDAVSNGYMFDGLENLDVTSWQGCLVVKESGKEVYTVDMRSHHAEGDHTGSGRRTSVPVYNLFRNQIIVHTSGGSETMKYVVQSTTKNRLIDGAGSFLDYVGQNRGYDEYRAAAHDPSTGSWGGFDIVNLVDPDYDEIATLLRVGTNGNHQVITLFWENSVGGLWHGTTEAVPGSNLVQCVPNFNSVYVSESLGAEVCLEVGNGAASAGSCISGSTEYGTYFNTCINSHTNSVYSSGSEEYWSVKLGKTSTPLNYGDFTANEEFIGEIILKLRE